MIGGHWLAGRCPERLRGRRGGGSAAHGRSHVGRNAVWFVWFCLLILNPQEERWPVFPHECARMHAAITRTFRSRVAALGCALAPLRLYATFRRWFLFEGLPHQITRYIRHSVFSQTNSPFWPKVICRLLFPEVEAFVLIENNIVFSSTGAQWQAAVAYSHFEGLSWAAK